MDPINRMHRSKASTNSGSGGASKSKGGLTFPRLDPLDSFAYAALHVLRHLLRGDLLLWHIYQLAFMLDGLADDAAFWSEWNARYSGSDRTLLAIPFESRPPLVWVSQPTWPSRSPKPSNAGSISIAESPPESLLTLRKARSGSRQACSSRGRRRFESSAENRSPRRNIGHCFIPRSRFRRRLATKGWSVPGTCSVSFRT